MLPTRLMSETDTHRLKVKVWKKIFHANENQKEAEVAALLSGKTDFKTKTVIRNKEEN